MEHADLTSTLRHLRPAGGAEVQAKINVIEWSGHRREPADALMHRTQSPAPGFVSPFHVVKTNRAAGFLFAIGSDESTLH